MTMFHNYLDRYRDQLCYEQIQELRRQKEVELAAESLQRYREAVGNVTPFLSKKTCFNQSVVDVGDPEELSREQHAALKKSLEVFIPWKKGPFRVFGQPIDSEWCSDLKWERILPHCHLEGKKVADIGCHNGYFMFRMLSGSPELVVGFEPYGKHWYNFQLIQQFVQAPSLAFEMLGVEHTDLYPGFFDTIFCLGILYHHTDPVGLLRKMRHSLAKGGDIIIDCQGIAGDDPVAFVPGSRYASARGIWFLPTLPALMNWIKRAGFGHAECFYAAPLNPSEQRSTAWAPVKSLKDFLDPEDSAKTVEGYPAPWRFYVKARR